MNTTYKIWLVEPNNSSTTICTSSYSVSYMKSFSQKVWIGVKSKCSLLLDLNVLFVKEVFDTWLCVGSNHKQCWSLHVWQEYCSVSSSTLRARNVKFHYPYWGSDPGISSDSLNRLTLCTCMHTYNLSLSTHVPVGKAKDVSQDMTHTIFTSRPRTSRTASWS